MPLFHVDVTETVTTYYSLVVVDAPSETEAIIKAEEMAMRGEISEGGSQSNWSSDVQPAPVEG